MLQNCYPGFYNPSVASVNPYPAQMSAVPANLLKGKTVNRLEDIIPNDVPMDGSIGVFPLSDYSKIYTKSWNSSGTIDTYEYTRNEIVQNRSEDPLLAINERLDKIEKLLQPKTAQKARKEEANE